MAAAGVPEHQPPREASGLGVQCGVSTTGKQWEEEKSCPPEHSNPETLNMDLPHPGKVLGLSGIGPCRAT